MNDEMPAAEQNELSMGKIQKIFEYYCEELQVNAISLMSFYKDNMLTIKNYYLNENVVKAIACTMPVKKLAMT